MTDQEAEVLAVRLTRIWGHGVQEWNWQRCHFRWRILLPERIHLSFASRMYADSGDERELVVTLKVLTKGRYPLTLDWFSGTSELRVSLFDGEGGPTGRREIPEFILHSQQFQDFNDKSITFFRRGCWLSGCDIEATAHEKAEWMQGFSQEELEAWNLKI